MGGCSSDTSSRGRAASPAPSSRYGAHPPRTKWTRRVPHPVRIGHAASLETTSALLSCLCRSLPVLASPPQRGPRPDGARRAAGRAQQRHPRDAARGAPAPPLLQARRQAQDGVERMVESLGPATRIASDNDPYRTDIGRSKVVINGRTSVPAERPAAPGKREAEQRAAPRRAAPRRESCRFAGRWSK
jgi:hypothetical protein